MIISFSCDFAGFVTPGPSNAALSCLNARQLCSEDPVCSQILEILPKVCGLELGNKNEAWRGSRPLGTTQDFDLFFSFQYLAQLWQWRNAKLHYVLFRVFLTFLQLVSARSPIVIQSAIRSESSSLITPVVLSITRVSPHFSSFQIDSKRVVWFWKSLVLEKRPFFYSLGKSFAPDFLHLVFLLETNSATTLQADLLSILYTMLLFQSLIRIRLMPCLHVTMLWAYAKTTETARKSTTTFNKRAKFKMTNVRWKHGNDSAF